MSIQDKIKLVQSQIYQHLVSRNKVTQQIADSQPPSETMAAIMIDATRVSKDDAAVAEAAAHVLDDMFYLALAEEGVAIRCAGDKDGWIVYSDYVCVTNPYDKALCDSAFAWARREDVPYRSLGVVSSSYLAQLRAAHSESNDDQDSVDDKLALQQIEAIIRNAAGMDASDVHFVPDQTEKVEVKYRIDGELRTQQKKIDLKVFVAMVRAVLEQKCNRTYEAIHQQDGKFDLQVSGNKTINLRVSTLPVIRGSETAPKLVVRLLGNNAALANLNRMGLSPHNLEKLLRYGNYPSGMIVLTGPTGSGKTTTLYAQLINMQNTNPNRNFHTVEDPVEIQQTGMSHTEVTDHLGFADALRALLRQDPDVILVGEMRDNETAELAFKASMTGHLVLSTLHTNNSHESVGRLQSMNIGTDLIVTNVTAFLAQRLVRCLCEHCKVAGLFKADQKRFAKYGQHKAFQALGGDTVTYTKNEGGCNHCNNYGEKGRRGILEIFEMTAAAQVELLNGKNPSILRREQISDGTFEDLWDDGLRLVAEGSISFKQLEDELKPYEVDRVGMNPQATSGQAVVVPVPVHIPVLVSANPSKPATPSSNVLSAL